MLNRKSILILMGSALLLLSACGGGGSNSSSSSSPSSSPSSSSSPSPSPSSSPSSTPTPSGPPVDIPVAVDDSAQTSANQAVRIDVLVNDQGSNLSLADTRALQGGAVQVEANQAVFTPAVNFTGTASFEYQVRDDVSSSNWALVSILVSPPDDNIAPVARNDSMEAYVGFSAIFFVLENDSDIDGHDISVVRVGNPSHGSVELSGTDVTYTPELNYVGGDEFTYDIADIFGAEASATVSVTVKAQKLMAIDDFIDTAIDTPVTFNVVANDFGVVAGSDINLTLVPANTEGAFVLGAKANEIVYSPPVGYSGIESIHYQIMGVAGIVSEATLSVRVHTPIDVQRTVDVASLSGAGVTFITDFPDDTDTKITNLFTRKKGVASVEKELLINVANAGAIAGIDSDFVYLVPPLQVRTENLSLGEFPSTDNLLGQFYHYPDDKLLDIQPALSIDGNQDGRNDLVLLRTFGLLYYTTPTPAPSMVDLDSVAFDYSALSSDTPSVMSATAGDFNADGIDDLAVAVEPLDNTSPKVKVFFGPLSGYTDLFATTLNGTNGFEITHFAGDTPATVPLSLAADDLNGDGQTDLIIGGMSEKQVDDSRTGQVYVLWGSSAPIASFSIKDFTHDSLNEGSRTTPAGTLFYWNGSEDESIGAVIKTADVNADGVSDLILGNSLRANLAEGRYMRAVSVIYGGENWSEARDVYTVTQSSSHLLGQRIVYCKENTSGGIDNRFIYALEVGDINGDNYADILLQTSGETTAVLGGSATKPYLLDAGNVMESISTLLSKWPVVTFKLVGNESPMAVLDMDGDGFDDVVLTRQTNSIRDGFIIYGGVHFRGQ